MFGVWDVLLVLHKKAGHARGPPGICSRDLNPGFIAGFSAVKY